MSIQRQREVIFEVVDTGQFLRITAFDVVTHTEVVTMAPRDLTQLQAHDLAYKKLIYVLEKDHNIASDSMWSPPQNETKDFEDGFRQAKILKENQDEQKLSTYQKPTGKSLGSLSHTDHYHPSPQNTKSTQLVYGSKSGKPSSAE